MTQRDANGDRVTLIAATEVAEGEFLRIEAAIVLQDVQFTCVLPSSRARQLAAMAVLLSSNS